MQYFICISFYIYYFNNDWFQESEWIEDPYYYEEYISEDDDDAGEDYSTKNVPIWLSILLVVSYIILGAYIFRVRI